MSMENQDLTSA
jgi:hypothetical protein